MRSSIELAVLMAVPGRDGGADVDACAGSTGGASSGGAAVSVALMSAAGAAAPGAGDSARTGVEDRDAAPNWAIGGIFGSGGVEDCNGGCTPMGTRPPGRGAALELREGGPLGGGGDGAAMEVASAPAFLLTHFFRLGS